MESSPVIHQITTMILETKNDYLFQTQRLNNVFNTGLKIWNQLPKPTKNSRTLTIFKRNISLLLGHS